MLKKIRNVLMFMMGCCLLGPTYIIYYDTNAQQHEAFWRERLGDWYESFPSFSIPIGLLLILFALVSSLRITLGNLRKPAE